MPASRSRILIATLLGLAGFVAYVALAFSAAVIFFGIFPSPLFDLVNHAGSALSGLVP